MRPAFSLIIFTTLSGLGFGLAMVVGSSVLVAESAGWVVVHGFFTLGLIGAGVLASTFHLGHPERAWRALSQWRTSWLSREGVLAAISLALLTAYFGDHWLNGATRNWAGIACALLSLATVFATAMIYASLKTVARWHHPLTPAVFLAFALAGGALLAATLAVMETGHGGSSAKAAMLALPLAGIIKIFWWSNAGRHGSGSTPESATGLGAQGKVSLIMPPHSNENWLQHEMGFVVARKHARRLRVIALLLAVALPLVILALASASSLMLGLAMMLHLLGVIVERWLFFAEAKHTVTLYYGDRH